MNIQIKQNGVGVLALLCSVSDQSHYIQYSISVSYIGGVIEHFTCKCNDRVVVFGMI